MRNRYDSVFEFESDKKCENTYVSNPFSHLDSWYTSCSSVFRWKRTSCRGFHAGQTTLGSFVTGRTASIPCLPCSCGGVVGACRARWTEYVPTWLHPRVCRRRPWSTRSPCPAAHTTATTSAKKFLNFVTVAIFVCLC
jgi:hypothetical protein